jgi:putative acetyltransferase
MLIREYQLSDAENLVAIFRDAIINIGSTAYNAEQIKVWSSYPEDIEEFRQLLSQGLTLVAVYNNQVAAFGQLNPSNHIAFIYTASNFARLGYATKIYQKLEAQAIKQGIQHLNTDASRISKYFFLKMGFSIVEAEIVERKQVWLERFKMKKILT